MESKNCDKIRTNYEFILFHSILTELAAVKLITAPSMNQHQALISFWYLSHLRPIYSPHGQVQIPEPPVPAQELPALVRAEADAHFVLVVRGGACAPGHPRRYAHHFIWTKRSYVLEDLPPGTRKC